MNDKHLVAIFVISAILLVGSVYAILELEELQDPEPVYDQYLSAEKDGYAKIVFMYTPSIEGNDKSCILEHEDAGIKVELSFFMRPTQGFYYWYHVVYNNGSIFTTNRTYIAYGANRTLVDFSEVYLSLSQEISEYAESVEQREAESLISLVFYIGFVISITFCMGSVYLWCTKD